MHRLASERARGVCVCVGVKQEGASKRTAFTRPGMPYVHPYPPQSSRSTYRLTFSPYSLYTAATPTILTTSIEHIHVLAQVRQDDWW